VEIVVGTSETDRSRGAGITGRNTLHAGGVGIIESLWTIR